jgi:hypothetical protein
LYLYNLEFARSHKRLTADSNNVDDDEDENDDDDSGDDDF